MVSSAAYPGLERKPGGPDNWVEAAGGLPSYIERIAKHLHYERGFTISHSIATAVNTVERWARGGTVTKDGTTHRITPKTQALASKAVAEWEAKKSISLSVQDPAYVAETELINKYKKMAVNQKRHKFTPAKWTHPNGHPRCLLCGDEERTGGICEPDINLAEPVIDDTATMVCFRIPEDIAGKVAVEGGVPVDELHITLGYFGKVAGEDAVTEIQRMVTECVQSYGEPLSGTIGGILAFPPGDKGQPWALTVDVPGISRLQLKLVEHFRGADNPIAEDHGYTPHVSLTFDDPQEPVAAIPVSFGSVALVRGNELVAEIPLGDDDGADEPEDGTLSSDGAAPKGGNMELSAMLQRARTIADPEAKARVRSRILELSIAAAKPTPPVRRKLSQEQRVALVDRITDGILDLALTKDGRQSFKRQGKWGHGFVPLDEKAVESKAKGSPIATKRINRIFGGARRAAKPTNMSATGKKFKPKPRLTVKSEGGGHVTAASASRLGGSALTKDATASQRVDPKAKKEVSRGRVSNPRATKPWEQLSDEIKTVRNGKRYVVATFNGQQQLTEWVGPNAGEDVKADPSKVRYRTMSRATAAKFSSGELRNLLEVPGQPKSVRSILNAALDAAMAKNKRRPA